MFQTGDKVVLGVSGGADSVCLLFVLRKLRELLGISLHVVHVNHGVREDAAEDAAYVEALCNRYRIPFMLEEIQLKELARELGVSQEEAGRIARYQAFEKACTRFGCQKIAVAHNSNDRAETMLFHLFRGTGLKGMAGIRPVRDNIVRPLLCLERWEIEAYLEAGGIAYRQDSTNEGDDYTRNRIRHHILPYAREHIAEGCVAVMCRAADIFAEEEAYLEEQTRAAGEVCLIDSRYTLSVEAFLAQHPVIQKRLLLQLLKDLSPAHQDIGAVHIEGLLTLFTKEGNRQLHLPYGIRGVRSYDRVWLERKSENGSVSACQGVFGTNCVEGKLGETYTINLPDGYQFVFKILENGQNTGEKDIFSENRYTKWFDYDKMIKPIQVRTRQTGDYLTIRSEDGIRHKRLKDYMVTEKIPRQIRDTIPLLAQEDHVIWLVGYRISEYYKVSADTKKILQVQLQRPN